MMRGVCFVLAAMLPWGHALPSTRSSLATQTPSSPKRFPTYTYPPDLDLSKSFPITVAKGRDLMLPLKPLHHALFPDVKPPGGVALGFAVSRCTGSMALSLVTSNATFELSSDAATACLTFMKNPNETTSPSLCPLFVQDDRFYDLDPHEIKGVVLMADLDEDLHVLASFTSTSTFAGFEHMFKADQELQVDIDASLGHTAFTVPTIVSPDAAQSPCATCSYRLVFGPSHNTTTPAVALPIACLLAASSTQLSLLPPSSTSLNASTHAADLSPLRGMSKGWYQVYLVADATSSSSLDLSVTTALLAYPPQHLFLDPPRSVVGTLTACVFLVAVVGGGLVVLYRRRRIRRRSHYGTNVLPPPSPLDADDAECIGLLSKTSYHTLHDAQDHALLDGYDDVEDDHVTV
ncbi:Aste57867_1820 [Aphanomyces stellatus]|uniref:Aste57867_1820 protein n=1 Tax=Aphanomyces stellatus TaxID=120398 RepID=A0A485K9M0_9STRA|nr:hypothetical protein As57867_001818 [Aphanomyces stellatus]VFT79029.1 Aste57867_1820 [Aphanomyces stellatus]